MYRRYWESKTIPLENWFLSIRVPARVIDRRCPICVSPIRETIDRMIGENISGEEIIAYTKQQHLEMEPRDLEFHRDRHFSVRVVEPRSVQEAQIVDPAIRGYNDLQLLVQQNNRELVNRDVDKIAEVMGVMEQQEQLIAMAMERVQDPEESAGVLRIAKELLESKLKSITLLGKLDGDVADRSGTNVNIMVQNIIPQVSKYIKTMTVEEKRGMLDILEKKKMNRGNGGAQYYDDDE